VPSHGASHNVSIEIDGATPEPSIVFRGRAVVAQIQAALKHRTSQRDKMMHCYNARAHAWARPRRGHAENHEG